MLKRVLTKSVVISLIASSYLLSNDTLQVEIFNSDKWQLIGVNGLHNESSTNSSGAGNNWDEVNGISSGDTKDTVDSSDAITWYNYDSSNSAVETTDDNASLGILMIKDRKLPDGSTTNNGDVVYVKGNFKPFDPTSTKKSMYLKGKSTDDPVLKIVYQADMEDTDIYIKFNNQNNDADFYINIKLNDKYTYDNAFVLDGNKRADTIVAPTVTTTPQVKILDVYDENLSDNNRSKFPSDKFVFADERTAKYSDTNITVFKYENGRWSLFNSRNINNNDNDFDYFEVGTGYWTKVQKSKDDPVGFIFATNSITDATWNTIYPNLSDGWNLISYNDEIFRVSPTGVFIELSKIKDSGLRITDAYGANSVEIISDACDTEKNASAYINFKVEQARQKGIANFALRAYPAQNYDRSKSGIVIISERRFEVNATSNSDFTTLAGDTLQTDDINNQFFPKYGEYLLGVKPNDSIFNLDAPIFVTIQGYDTITNDSKVDLSNQDLSGFADRLNSGLSNIKKDHSAVYLIDTNWDDQNETILMAVDKRFGIKESSYYKLFKQIDSGSKVYVEGAITGKTAPIATVDSNFSKTVEDINNTYDTSKVKAFETNSTLKTLALISEQADLDLKEDGTKNSFEDLKIGFDDHNDTEKGAILQVYDVMNFADAAVYYYNDDEYNTTKKTGQTNTDLSSITLDLKHQTFWTKDFATDSGIIQKMAKLSGKKIEKIFSASNTENGTRWLSLDATKPLNEWFRYNDQDLMWTEKERGYWVYLTPYTPATITHTLNGVSGTKVTTHFNNNISTNGTSTTDNYIRKDISISTAGAGVLEYTYASIDGKTYPFINNSNTKIVRIDSYEMGLEQNPIDISISLHTYDGLGSEIHTPDIATVSIVQPSAPSLSWDATTGDLTISNTDFTKWEIHENNISDIAPEDSLKATVTGSSYKLSDLELDGDWSKITDTKPYFDLKVVTVGSNGFYSDIQAFSYSPVHENTHVLTTNSTTYDELPGTYIANETALTRDSGVGLKSLTNNTITLAYHPQKKDGVYLKLGETIPNVIVVDYNSTRLATIKFVDEYIGKKFYLYDGASKTLLYGTFTTGHDSSDNAYTLTAVPNYGHEGQIIIKP